MSANLPQKAPVIKDWLKIAVNRLENAGIGSARLDAELILADILNKQRTHLHAHNDDLLDSKSVKAADLKLNRRLDNEPIAYIVGSKEFFGRRFVVSSDTLIPRPESEDLIEILGKILKANIPNELQIKLVDVGTGCGCLGITAKLEFPFLDVTLTDISKAALKIAKLNASANNVNVNILNMNLLENYNNKPNLIIANLPYVDPNWKKSLDTSYEPPLALFANNQGLSVIEKLIVQASDKLIPGGYLIIEADPTQHKTLIKYAKTYHFQKIIIENYVVVFKSS